MEEHKIIRMALLVLYIFGTGYLSGRSAKLNFSISKAFTIGASWGFSYGIILAVYTYYLEWSGTITRNDFNPLIGVLVVFGLAILSGSWSAHDAYKASKQRPNNEH